MKTKVFTPIIICATLLLAAACGSSKEKQIKDNIYGRWISQGFVLPDNTRTNFTDLDDYSIFEFNSNGYAIIYFERIKEIYECKFVIKGDKISFKTERGEQIEVKIESINTNEMVMIMQGKENIAKIYYKKRK